MAIEKDVPFSIPSHRQYTALGILSAVELVDVNASAVEKCLAMLAKEPNETALSSLIGSLGKHLAVLIACEDDGSTEFVGKARDEDDPVESTKVSASIAGNF